MRQRVKVTREEWAKRVERWKDSGLSLSQYSGEVGVSASALKWWKWRLESDAKAKPGSLGKGKYRRNLPKQAPGAVTFVELPLPGKRRQAPIEIVLSSRVRIRVQADFEVSTLERVLTVLGARK
jgi:hypothetical protein